METGQDYKYLGEDNKLNWAKDTDAGYKKGKSRLYFLLRLRSFNVCSTMLRMFYQSVVASASFFAIVCWGNRVRTVDANKINKIIRKSFLPVAIRLYNSFTSGREMNSGEMETSGGSSTHGT